MTDPEVLVRRSCALTPLAPTVARLAELVADPGADVRDIVTTLTRDPVLAAAVLRRANSATYTGRAAVAAVPVAVVRLGTDVVLGLAMRDGLRAAADRSSPECGFSEVGFRGHAVAASLAVDAMRPFVRARIPAAAKTAALLHDIGKLAMAQFLAPAVLRRMWCAPADGGRSRCEAERAVLGVDHAELGARMVQHWRLPECIRIGVAWHHDPDRGGSVLVDVVHVATHLADRLPITPTDAVVGPSPRAMQRLGMQVGDLDEVAQSVLGAMAVEDAARQPVPRP